MKNRCTYESQQYFMNYGGRGIRICDEWLLPNVGFSNFESWAIKSGYSDNLTLDRINNDVNYEPSNCRWVDRKTQNKNKRNSCYVTYRGERMHINDFSEKFNLSKSAVYSRFVRGWDVERIIKTPINKKEIRTVEYNGKTVTLNELSEITGISPNTIKSRYQKGYSIEKITSKERVNHRYKGEN